MYEVFERLISELGITPYKVSKDTGITTATLTSWKQGKYVPKKEKLQKIADYLGVTLDALMGENNESENKITLTDEEIKNLKVLKVNDKLKILFDEVQGLDQSDVDFVLDMVKKLKK